MISDVSCKLYPHPGNPLPPKAKAHWVETTDGTRLRAMTASPANPKATVVVMGGRADYIERYFETCRDLTKRGYAVVTFDWRGQGASQRLHHDRNRGHGGSFKGFDDDLESVMHQLAELNCQRPFYALAHSTGGNVLLRSLRQRPTWFEKAAVTSPLLGFIYGKWPPVVANSLASLAVATGLGAMFLPGFARGPLQRNEFSGNPLTSDPDRWDRDMTTMEAHPDLGTGGPTFGWFKGALASITELQNWKRSSLIACPVLLVAAGQEWVVAADGGRKFAERVPGVSFLQIRGARHEILMERDEYRDQFWAAFDSFIGQ